MEIFINPKITINRRNISLKLSYMAEIHSAFQDMGDSPLLMDLVYNPRSIQMNSSSSRLFLIVQNPSKTNNLQTSKTICPQISSPKIL
jgi:hypothetical protein